MTQNIFSVNDARRLAKKRMPRVFFDFIDGAAGAEKLNAFNHDLIEKIRLQPRVLINVENRCLKQIFLDREWSLPFGIAPMGMCNLTWPGADTLLAKAAARHNIPLAISTAASTSLEDLHLQSSQRAWFQLYVGQSEKIAMDLVRRADDTGFDVLIFTVDVPQVANRIRDLKNGFQTTIKFGVKQILDFALHPNWSLSTLKQGIPRIANYSADQGENAFNRNASRGRVDWDFLKRLRDRWPRKLIVKGVLSPTDAVRIRDVGADAVYVSNHGGRQLDSAPASIDVLPSIRQAVGDHYPLLFDSGIRNGEDILKALALGANFVMIGRPLLYGIGANGAEGLESVIKMFESEISLTLAQLGKTAIKDIDGSIIAQHASTW